MLAKNTAGQGVYLYAWNTSTNAADTGDAANITGAYTLDGVDTVGFGTSHPTEIAGGIYWQVLAQGETNGNAIAYRWSTTTANVVIRPVFVLTTGATLPAVAPAASGGLPTVGTGNGQISPTGGAVNVNLAQPLTAARALDAIPDTSLQLNDGFHCAIAGAVGKKNAVGTSYVVETPFTATVLRTFVVTLSAPPTTVPTALN